MKWITALLAFVAVCTVSQIAIAQTGTAPFCLQTPAGTRCVFGTMGECESARGSASSGQCITRTDAHGTTGLGEPPANYSGTRVEPVPPTEREGPLR
jgi:hypothetical protein